MQISLIILMASVGMAQAQWDFSKFPAADVPPPINAAWSESYGVGNLAENSIPVKMPLNSLEYPACPSSPSAGCDWSCWNCTAPDDILDCRAKNEWALTYDDGPSNNSLIILDALAKANIKATFCVVGSRVPLFPQVLKRMYEEGHEICVHTWSHRYLTSQTNDQIVAEMEWTIQAVQQVIGLRPTLARPPFGDMDDRVRAVLRAMKLRDLLWNRDTKDWRLNSPMYNFSPAWIPGNFTQWIRDAPSYDRGFISLQHDLYSLSVSEAPNTVAMVRSGSFSMKKVSECTGIEPYTKPVALPNTTTPSTFPKPPAQTGKSTSDEIATFLTASLLVLPAIVALFV